MTADAGSILNYYDRHLWGKPGQHFGFVAPTGGGKTNSLYYAVDKILECNPEDKIVWFDPGKSSEIAGLALFKPLMLHIPEGCSIEIKEIPGGKYQTHKHEVKTFRGWRTLWKNIRDTPLEYINVVCFEPYITGGQIYTKAVAGIFDELIEMVKSYQIRGPMSIILDELQSLAPSRTNEINPGHYTAGGKLQFNIERLRSEKIRIGGAMQGWTKVRYGVRSSLMWVGAKQGARFTKDEPTLARFNHLWNNLKLNQIVIVDRNRKWRGILETPFYCDGADLWEVRYYGKLKTKTQEHKDEELILEAAS